ncbi:MAG TPA: VOC family protein [Miltoncostaeaceae bacterium]|nr:VOC family protein [Miltoncostaeaceae bacterium]
MPHPDAYPLGAPCWADLAVPDLPAATAFYAGLAGWRAEAVPGSDGAYVLMHAAAGPVCGVCAMAPERVARGEETAWLLYLAADDAGARAARAAELGGTVVAGPYEVPGAGRAAVVGDPAGARFALWQAGGMAGAAVVDGTGAMVWSELATPDRRAAAVFYTALLGLRAEEVEGPFGYTVLVAEGAPVAGVYEPDDGRPAGWTPYLAHDDVEAAAGLAVAAGGRVLQDPFATPDGRIAVIADPWGAVLAVAERAGA